MGNKYIVVGGKKVYIKDGEEPEVKDEDEEPAAEIPEGEIIDKPEEEPSVDAEAKVDAEVKKVSSKIVQNIKTELGFDKLTEKINQILDNGNSDKFKSVLNNSELAKQKDKMTKEEIIVSFFKAIVNRDHVTAKALSEGTAGNGGYLFPDEFRAELIKWLDEKAVMRNLVTVIPMRRDVMKIPSLDESVRLTWTAENETKSTTTAHFNEKTLTARKVAAILYASDELIADSEYFDVVQLIIKLFGERLAIEENRVITAGNGTTEPTGISAVTAGHTQAMGGNLTFDGIINLIYSLPQTYHANAKFLVHRTNIREMRKLKDSQNRYLWWDPVSGQGLPTLMGYEVVENNNVSEATIYFGDWKKAYYLGDRQQLTVKITQDTETAFTKDMTAIRVVARLAGYPVLPDAYASLTGIP